MMTSTSSINTNAPAMQYQSQLSRSIDKQNTSMERLSSGLKINTAKDDAAGLQISNRLLVQNRGMDVAIRNANDGISVLQTAEGAMKEYTENLMRMRELALRYENGSLNSEDKSAINQEYTALVDELTRISNTTSFAQTKLLNGSKDSISFQIGATSGEAVNVNLPNLEKIQDSKTDFKTIYYMPISNWNTSWEVPDIPDDPIYENVSNYIYFAIGTTDSEGNKSKVQRYNTDIASGATLKDMVDLLNEEHGDKADFYLENDFANPFQSLDGKADQLRISIHPKGEGFYHLDCGVFTVGSSTYPFFKGAPIPHQEHFQGVIDIPELEDGTQPTVEILDNILEYIDSERAKLGSIQNRLSHAINNLSQSSENVADSHSQIRDTDFAKESTQLTKQSILKEVNTSMLAQAGNAPRIALNLLS
ncbi:flagellin [Vibrio antiquarius]|uniref:flagellin N-terminal helical domain-containing protein n=1 Tax=Vibrio antiquarius (strain Ex25) TaxID=150340 RepID=UPI0015B75988|nr:flagellin [Vibrio antiquarius]MCR9477784.1 flagellin [Vibrio antiquarius]NWK15785.1 flagellin [Vibrio parahaemolyticus]